MFCYFHPLSSNALECYLTKINCDLRRCCERIHHSHQCVAGFQASASCLGAYSLTMDFCFLGMNSSAASISFAPWRTSNRVITPCIFTLAGEDGIPKSREESTGFERFVQLLADPLDRSHEMYLNVRCMSQSNNQYSLENGEGIWTM